MLRISPIALAIFLMAASGFAQAAGGSSQGAAPAPVSNPNANNAKDNQEDLTCVISGIVVRNPDGAPLKGATVMLDNSADQERKIATKTTADGHFELKNVPPAQYHLSITKNGYVTQKYGQRKPEDPGSLMTLRPKERKTDLSFKLIRAGVISGKIYDEDGEPMMHVGVSALRQSYRDGKKEFEPRAYAQTNDLGEYRLFGLPAGQYFVSADLEHWGTSVGDREYQGGDKGATEKGYTKVFYPGFSDIGKASSVFVKTGEEIPSTDIMMTQVTVYRVRGRIVFPFAHKAKNDTQVMMMRRGSTQRWDILRGQDVDKSDGTFEVADVPSGEYTLIAYFFDQDKPYATEQDVDVTAADVDGLTLILSSGSLIRGTLQWDGKPATEGVPVISLLPLASGAIWGGQAHIEDDNRFTLKSVPDGTFRIEIGGLGQDCYIKQIAYGETVITDKLLHVRGSSGDMQIVVSSKGSRIDGMVTNDESTPVAGIWVVAVPDEARRSDEDSYRAVTSDQYGRYSIRGLKPGAYKLFSWDGVEQGQWEDRDFLKQTEAKGISISVADGDTKSTDLQVIPVNESARAN
jgi:Carboxypeptidase regulatory-like domain